MTEAIAHLLTSQFITLLEADIIVLGEMSGEDANKLESLPEFAEFSVFNGALPAGPRSSFDTCLLFRKDKLELTSWKNLIVNDGTRSIKLGQRFDFAVVGYDRPLYVIASHWPSRLWCEQNHTDRPLLAIRLRERIKSIMDEEGNAHIVLIGDYNDEPFDHSLSEHLQATRDRALAAVKSHLFYNPFWRHLSRKEVACSEFESIEYAGSYFHRAGNLTQWRTFDQIMFSSSFLGNGDWNLIDKKTVVLDIPAYTAAVLNSNYSFDHLPIMAVIERNTND